MAEAQPDLGYLTEMDRVGVLIAGSGAREKAIGWKLEQSERIGAVTIRPNGKDFIDFATDPENGVDLVIVSTDDDLAAGLVDDLAARGIPAFGPNKQAARIESSKPYAKHLMTENGVPTANFQVFTDPTAAHEYVEANPGPRYGKAGGLALGKGAMACPTPEETHRVIDEIMVKKVFKDAGNELVLEDLLEGDEISLHAITDGETYLMFPSSQDHKKALEGDLGDNTGGMGTLSPVPWFDQDQVNKAGLTVVKPVLDAMSRNGNAYKGLLYPGIMVDENGNPKVLEYNARFGDPEVQVYLRRMESDFLDLITATVARRLGDFQLKWSDQVAVCLVAASGGYPGAYERDKRITGIEEAEQIEGIKVFHAGVTEKDGQYFTSGGRVLGVSSMADTLIGALSLAYVAMQRIQFEGKYVRPDIGHKSLLRAGLL